MKHGFYRQLAWNNVKKNYRFYIPHILAGAGLLACFYIVSNLATDNRLLALKGGDYLPFLMSIGTAVMSLLSVILILYTNSFLMRQRKREYGMYIILGMEKRHVVRVLWCETLISAGASLLGGVFAGLLLYKACSLLICRLLKADIVLGFYFIRPLQIFVAVGFFTLLYFVSFLLNRHSIRKMKPVDLLASKATGEKEPKVKWAIFILGILALGTGYYLAVCHQNPISALTSFFPAVILVIIGTYFLFTAGSIFVLKRLKKNTKYYYNKKHMSSVAGLLYRMKQNAVGMASIAVLGTGVLIMVSSTVSLYTGMQETMANNYPQQLYYRAWFEDQENKSQEVPLEAIEPALKESAEENGVTITAIEEQSYLEVSYVFKNNCFLTKDEAGEAWDYSDICTVIFVTNDMYEKATGERLAISGNEIGICRLTSDMANLKLPQGSISIGGEKYQICDSILFFPISTGIQLGGTNYGVVLADDVAMEKVYHSQLNHYGKVSSQMSYRIAVTYREVDKLYDVGKNISEAVFTATENYSRSQGNFRGYSISLDTYWDALEAIVGMYGCFLFLGIILGTVCLFATTLIMYYKQISEGYEDRERFQIMKKVGLSSKEIKATIGTQTRLVFFMPLITAGIHTAFAFPLIRKLLAILMLSSSTWFLICSLITYGIFAILYTGIYLATAKTYYKIVH